MKYIVELLGTSDLVMVRMLHGTATGCFRLSHTAFKYYYFHKILADLCIAFFSQSLDANGYVNKKMARRLDKCLKYVLISGKKALQDAEIPYSAGTDAASTSSPDVDRNRCGILIGSAMGGMTSFSAAIEALVTQGGRVGSVCFEERQETHLFFVATLLEPRMLSSAASQFAKYLLKYLLSIY